MLDIQELINDKKFVRFVINKYLPIHKLFEMIEQRWSYDYNVFCPFHDNHDTPAARLYKDSNTLYCFSEQKGYRPSDFIEKELINARLESVFYKLWRQLDDYTKEEVLNNYNLDSDYQSTEFKEALPQLEKFKTGEITLSELRQMLIKLL